jgi:predicted DNA-binding protein
MPSSQKAVRRTVSLPPRIARRVHTLARQTKRSTTRVIVDLIESGIEAKERERKRFFELAERLARSTEREEQVRLKEELARMTFGG